ncbi:TPA: GIY-YIG nuclease family protein [Salmonella enterica subsp. enterica serovar Kottbus]
MPAGESLKGFNGYVYFIKNPISGLIKIGYSKNPWARLSELRRNYGSDLSVVATIKTVDKSEVSIYTALSKYRVEGEWFTESECIKSLISLIVAGEITTVDATNYYASNYGSAPTATTNTDPDKDTDLKDQNLLRGAEKISPPPPDENRESCGLNLHDGTGPAHAGPERRPLSAGVPELPRPDDPEFIRLPLNDGSEFAVTESLISEFESLYPAVDVRQALRNQRGWLLSDQRRRKTARGIKKFITCWLAKDQDRGGNRGRDSPVRIQDLPPPDNVIPPGFRG